MMLRATWSLRDEHDELIAHGTHNLDELVHAAGDADPYEAAARIAQFVEQALIEYLLDHGRPHPADPRQILLFSDVVQ